MESLHSITFNNTAELKPKSGESEAGMFLAIRQHYWFTVENSKRKVIV
jgi:hypothetical protein